MKNTFLIKMTMVYLNNRIQLQTEMQIKNMVQFFLSPIAY